MYEYTIWEFNGETMGLFCILFFGLMLRIVLSGLFLGYPHDISCFTGWSMLLYEDGLSNFYVNEATFTDYPPGYMYVLYGLGALRSLLGISPEAGVFVMLIKMPAIIFDLAATAFLYKKFNVKAALFYCFNPAILINSAVWGQVDAIYTFLILISLYLLAEEDNLLAGFFVYTLAILIKPQSLIFAPVYLYYLYNTLQKNKFDKKTFLHILYSGLICFTALFALMLPFTKSFDFLPIFEQYIKTLSSYAYASVNAYNVYTAFGFNWVPAETKFLFLSFHAWGTISIICIVIFSFYSLSRKKRAGQFYFVAALINMSTYMFAVKMHERYVFPSLLLFFVAALHEKNKQLFVAVCILSVTLFINCYDILYMVLNGNYLSLIEPSAKIVSFINIALYFFIVYLAFPKRRKLT